MIIKKKYIYVQLIILKYAEHLGINVLVYNCAIHTEFC